VYEIIDDDSEHSSNSALPVRAPYYARWNRARPSHIHLSTLLSADHATGAAHGEACHKSTHTRAPHPPARPRARERTHTRTHTDQSACHRCYTQRTVPNACAVDGYGRRRWLRLCPCGTQRSPFVTRPARCSRGGCGRSRCDRRAGSQPRLLPHSVLSKHCATRVVQAAPVALLVGRATSAVNAALPASANRALAHFLSGGADCPIPCCTCTYALPLVNAGPHWHGAAEGAAGCFGAD
jgi:hypothetical protein